METMRASSGVAGYLVAGLSGLLAVTNPGPAAAQAPDPGDTVRVTTQEERIVGRLVEWDDEGLVVRLGGDSRERAVRPEAVERLEVHAGTRHHAVAGALAGGGAGAGVGLGFALAFDAHTRGALWLTAIGGAGGAGLGALIGSAVRTDRWEEASGPRLQAGPGARPGSVALSIIIPMQ